MLIVRRCGKTSCASDVLLRRVEDLVGKRTVTDRRMGYVWVLVPVLPIFLATALAASLVETIVPVLPDLRNVQETGFPSSMLEDLSALYGVALITVFIALLLSSLSLYYLIDRRNAHFKRQQPLFAALSRYLQIRESGLLNEASTKLALMSEDSMLDEQDRPAGLWAILNFLATPIVSVVVAHNLTHDLCRHDERQIDFQSTLGEAFGEVGFTPPSASATEPLKRDTVLFLILTVITGGLFWVYWFYALLKDYNEHFAKQARFEDAVLASLKPRAEVKVCAVCSGPVPENARFCPFCGKDQTG